MAIYHVSFRVISRNRGQSAVAAAAYRARQSLFDERYGTRHNFRSKGRVDHEAILAPLGAPEWVFDRQRLWNSVEAFENRKDAQLAREMDVALPLELSEAEQVELLREFVETEFVSQGMVADLTVHRDNAANPRGAVLLSLREMTSAGWNQRKARHWNSKATLAAWRQSWAEHANRHLANAGHAVRIDHRTLAERGIDLAPGRKLGVAVSRFDDLRLPDHLAERVVQQRDIARENGDAIVADPGIVLHAMAQERGTFSRQDIARFLRTRTQGAEQFETAMRLVMSAKELIPIGRDAADLERFTTRGSLNAQSALFSHVTALNKRRDHSVPEPTQEEVLRTAGLSINLQAAFRYLLTEGDLKTIVRAAGSDANALLRAARSAWEIQGLSVRGLALSGRAVSHLEAAVGLPSKTLADFESAWVAGRDQLTASDVLIFDEAGIADVRGLERVLDAASKANAKLVLIADVAHLQSTEAGAIFRGVSGRTGMVMVGQGSPQHERWACEAGDDLARGDIEKALTAYEAHGALVPTTTGEEALKEILNWWVEDAKAEPQESRLIIAPTRADARRLNEDVRKIRHSFKELGPSMSLDTLHGPREVSVNDRIVVLRRIGDLRVAQGALGTIEKIERGALTVMFDGRVDAVAIPLGEVNEWDLGYALAVHDAQRSMADRSYVLAGPQYDRYTAYVALSRHREAATVFYALEEFEQGTGAGVAKNSKESRRWLVEALSRARPAELLHDFLERV